MRLRIPVKRLKLSSLLCFTIKFTTIREAIDVRDLGESCVKINGDKTVSKILYAIEDKICNG